ncbi:MAG TPA: hypothetical protein V6D00_09015 [Pantanalinema sp.]
MSAIRLILPLVAAVALAGCAQLPFGTPTRPAEGKASLQIRTQLASGAYRTQTAGIMPYGQDDVVHLLLKLYRVNDTGESAIADANGRPITKDVLKADLGTPVGFVNLHPNTRYRIKAYAYKATGEAEGDLISFEASSSLDVQVDTDERPTVGELRVQLADRPFRAEATSSIVFDDGTLTNVDEVIEPGQPRQ